MTVSTFTVATGAYVQFLDDLVPDIDRFLFTDQWIDIHVFTDQPELVAHLASTISPRSQLVVHSVPALRWPEATLFRYELISDVLAAASGDICVHLDADLRIVREVGSELQPHHWAGGLAAVLHPGYWRSGRPANVRDISKRVTTRIRGRGRMGAWERNTLIRAYAPWRKRKNYVCGGVWMGLRQPFERMVNELAVITHLDYAEGRIPIWHDESYLNSYVANHQVTLLDPSYCYAREYPWLQSLQPRIIAVNKGDWQRT